MKLNDVIDIDGKLYKVIHISDDGSFEAEPIGEVIAKGFVRPQNEKHESISLDEVDKEDKDKQLKIEALQCYCDKQEECHKVIDGVEIPCHLYYDSASDCIWHDDISSEYVNHDYELIKGEL